MGVDGEAGRVVGRVGGVWAGVTVAAAVVSGRGVGAGGAGGRIAVWLIGSVVVQAIKTVSKSTLRIIDHSLLSSCTLLTALRASCRKPRISFERVVCIVKV